MTNYEPLSACAVKAEICGYRLQRASRGGAGPLAYPNDNDRFRAITTGSGVEGGVREMEQIAFLMRLKLGCEQEYRQRHDEIWPQLKAALTQAGIRDYSIFLDEVTLTLFAVLRLTPDNTRDGLPSLPIMRRWWDFMAELMEVDRANRPVDQPLTRVFHMD